MITNIALENFKCFRKVAVNPRRITAFVGPNGTGKSSVLQALALLKQSVGNNNLNLQGPLVNLLSHMQLQPNFEPRSKYNTLGFGGSNSESLKFVYHATLTAGRITSREEGEPGVAAEVLANLKMVHAARGLVRPSYGLGPQLTEDISFLNGLGEQEQQTATNLVYTRSNIEEKISAWTKRVTGVGLRANMVPPQSVEVKAITSFGDVNIVGEGFGTNSLIVLFLQLASAAKGATVLIEEPEIHLHPKAQAELASVLVEEAQVEDKQIIMTTHSEYILNRLLTLVAEKKLSPDDVAIYAFEKDEKGECTANEIKVFEDGRVQGGIKDFFEPHMEEMNRYVQAQFARLQPEE